MDKDTWITREGHEIAVTKMSSSHLLSAIHFIERNRFMSASETYFNGDNKDNTNYYLRWPDQYEVMITEAQRRGLIYRNVEGLVRSKRKRG